MIKYRKKNQASFSPCKVYSLNKPEQSVILKNENEARQASYSFYNKEYPVISEDIKDSTYKDYLKSDRWKKIRKKHFSKDFNRKCFICNKTDVILNIHHNTYKRLGRELSYDLISLCEDCHNLCHLTLKNKSKEYTLKNVARRLRRKHRNFLKTKGD